MGKKIICLLFTVAAFVLLANYSYAAELNEDFSNEDVLRSGELKESYRVSGNVGVFVDGIGFMQSDNQKKGKLVVRGVPENAEVKQAFLYWLGFPKQIDENSLGSLVFNGKVISPLTDNPAVLIAEEDPEGNAPKRQVYQADVSELLHEEINGTYKVSPLHKKKDNFGAVLVLIYEDSSLPESTLIIQDGLVMLSEEMADKVENGNAYDVIFDDLGGIDLTSAKLITMISDGAAKDKNDIKISGKPIKNVTRNNKKKSIDIIDTDLSAYFKKTEDVLEYEVKNVDDKGYYSHLFMSIVQSKTSNVDLSTSTLEVSKSQGKPGEIVDYSAEIINSSDSSVNDVIFEVDVPVDAEFVEGSISVEGFSQTDNEDLDDAHYDPVKHAVVVQANSLLGNDSMEVDFQIEIVKGVDHDDAVSTQGQVIVDGQQFLTDGDGDPIDGIDSETVVAVEGGLITALPAGFNVYLKDFPAIDPRVVKKTGIHTVVFEINDIPVAEIDLDLDNDQIIDSIIAAAELYQDRAFFHGFQGIPGVAAPSYTLLIPWNGTGQVRLCLGATSIDQIEPGCKDSYDEVYEELLFNPGETIGDITCNISEGFWRCDGVTGSGGQGEGEGGGVPEFSTMMHFSVLLFALLMIFLKREELISLQHRSFSSLFVGSRHFLK